MSDTPDNETMFWFQAFAKVLGCKPEPVDILYHVEQDRRTILALQERLRTEVSNARTQGRDETIQSFRRTAVNCGQSSSCAVSHWAKTSTELAEFNAKKEEELKRAL